MALGVIIMIQADTFFLGVISALVFGNGLGGMSTLINVLWADYYGRESLGVIRGVSLPIQTGGQAIGPIASGVLYDSTGNYFLSLVLFLITSTPPILCMSRMLLYQEGRQKNVLIVHIDRARSGVLQYTT